MRRSWLAMLAIGACALAAPQLTAQQKPVHSYELAGCDGIKSCHRMWFEYKTLFFVGSSGFPLGIWETLYAVQGTFNIPGAYDDPCYDGCAWDVTPANSFWFPGFNEHIKHAPSNCAIIDPLYTQSSRNVWCTGTNPAKPNFRFLYIADANWRPESAEVYVRYQEDGIDGVPTVVKLSLVPEPSTYATTALGLLAVAFAVRRGHRKTAH